MARTKIALGQPGFAPSADPPLDINAVSAFLSSEYPLVDAPLIIALLSDYEPLLESHIDEIRSQLGIIEATLIPDTDASDAEIPELVIQEDGQVDTSSLDDMADVDQKLTKLAFNDPPPFARDATSSSSRLGASSRSSKPSRSGSVSESKSSSTTSPTDVTDSDGGFEDDVALLKSLFPGIDEQTLKNALVAESGVPAAIDHLLSVELIRDVERDGHWPGEEDTDPEEMARTTRVEEVKALVESSLPPIPGSLKRSRSRKQASKAKAVPLVDTLQRRSAPPFRPSSRPSSRGSSPVRGGPSSNAWGTVASLAEILSELVPPHPTTYFTSYLHSPKYHSAYSAVRAALANVPPARSNTMETDLPARAILQDIYGLALEGDKAANADLELCVKTVGEDVAVVMDLMDLLGEISQWPGDDDLEVASRGMVTGAGAATKIAVTTAMSTSTRSDGWTSADEYTSDEQSSKPSRAAPNANRLLTRPGAEKATTPTERIIPGSKPPPSAWASPTAYDAFGLPSNFSTGSKRSKSKERQIHPQNWRDVHHARVRPSKILHPLAASIPSYARGITPHNSTPNSLFHTDTQINDCLTHAAAERLKRNECIRAAGRSYRLPGGKAANGAVSGAYAMQAREATERAREWELKAARMIVKGQLDGTGYTIDLHHMTVHEAVTVALESAARWYEKQKALYDEGQRREAREREGGFAPVRGLVVVVGVGRHSAGKRGVIGPAVGTALEEAGWRVERGEAGRGYMVVKGRK